MIKRKKRNKKDKVIVAFKNNQKIPIKLRHFDEWMNDCDYYKLLTNEEYNFIARYFVEEKNGWKPHEIDSIYSQEFLQNKLDEIFKDPDQIKLYKERKVFFEKKDKKKYTDLQFIKDEYFREANKDVPHRRNDIFSFSSNKIEAPDDDNVSMDSHLEYMFENYSAKPDPEWNELLQIYREGNFEYFLYDSVVEMVDGLIINENTKNFSKELMKDLHLFHKKYVDNIVDRISFYIFLYTITRVVLIEDSKNIEAKKIMNYMYGIVLKNITDKKGRILNSKTRQIKKEK